MTAMPIVVMCLPVNVFLAALFTKCLGLHKTWIGLITALPFICNFLQVGITPLLAKICTPKTISLIASSLNAACWIVLIFILPGLYEADPAAAGAGFAIWFFFSSLFSAVGGVAWNAWAHDWVPSRLRGKYFGKRNRILQLSTLAFLMTMSWFIAQGKYSITAFQWVIAGAILLRIFSIGFQLRMPTDNLRVRKSTELQSWRDQFAELKRARSLLVFIAFGAMWTFGTNLFGAFYYTFMYEVQGMSTFKVGLITTLSALGGALSMPGWGQLIDRYGNKAVMAVSLIMWQLPNYLWSFQNTQNQNLQFVMWLWGGMTSAGLVLGQFTLLLKLTPERAKNLAIGANLAITAIFAAIAPVLGGATLQRLTEHMASPASAYHLCFAIQTTIVLASAFLLLRIDEPAARPLTQVVGAMRNIRTISGVLGLGFLTNYIFYRQAKR